MDKKDTLERAPRFLSPELWEAIKPSTIHLSCNPSTVMGVSLLQGPPGTGKTKTIMGLLSGLLSLRLPATAVMPMAARSRRVKVEQPGGQAPSPRAATTTFSLKGLRCTGEYSSSLLGFFSTGPSSQERGVITHRLESKLSSRTHHSSSNLVVKRRIISRAASERSASRTNNILLCAPSNGAVNELVLRIVTDGLMDSSGNVTKVRAPSVHPEALSEEFISIVRLGNAGEDASEIVNSVCLPHIIRREMAIHPKAMQLHSLQDTSDNCATLSVTFTTKQKRMDKRKTEKR
ncbi:P-loop containing nucleoside triphosphate hydrolase [Phytophthora cactorum]|nr:P-loop containing nucleoside triphosphate hydrolase [Phytophthora cactorum]